MGNPTADPLKLKIAKQCAQLFLAQTASMTADVQLMAVEILARAIFTTNVTEAKRLELFDRWAKAIRLDVLKGVSKNAKKQTRNR